MLYRMIISLVLFHFNGYYHYSFILNAIFFQELIYHNLSRKLIQFLLLKKQLSTFTLQKETLIFIFFLQKIFVLSC